MTAAFVPQIALYRTWLAEQRGLTFASYEEMRQWSVRDLDGFWHSIWDYYDLQSPTPFAAVITERKMPGAIWFPGAQVNYARQVFRHVDAADAAGLPAIVSCGEDGRLRETSWPELRRKAAALALHLKEKGIKPGDRVAAYLPNIPETIIAFLASASIGAVWSVCAPDMAAPAVIDRFKQIEPKVLIACDAVTYAGRRHDRKDVLAELRRSLPTVEHVILHSEAAAPQRRTPCSPTSSQARAPRSTRSSRSGCRSIIRSGSSIPAAPPACRSRSCTAMAASSSWCWRCWDCTTISAAPTTRTRSASAITGTLRPAGSCGIQPGRRPAQRHHLLHLRRQPRRRQGQAGLDHAVALRRAIESDLLRCRRGVLRQLRQGRD